MKKGDVFLAYPTGHGKSIQEKFEWESSLY